ncbi:MAG TPA: hypothetical protein VFT74_11515 [Isosphaeraceae bacterium]|nr:hypothetical protein [Isosphaeraceae bacterium]
MSETIGDLIALGSPSASGGSAPGKPPQINLRETVFVNEFPTGMAAGTAGFKIVLSTNDQSLRTGQDACMLKTRGRPFPAGPNRDSPGDVIQVTEAKCPGWVAEARESGPSAPASPALVYGSRKYRDRLAGLTSSET